MKGGGADPRDPGLQPERTVMAWQRTILSLAAADLLLLRMFLSRLDGWAIAAMASTVIALGVLWAGAVRRQQRTLYSFPSADAHHRGLAGTPSLMPGGRTLALFALASAGTSVGALLRILLSVD